MQRTIRVAQEFVFGPSEVVIELSLDDVTTLAVELTLLLSGYASGTELRSPSKRRVVLSMASSVLHANAFKNGTDEVRFILARNEVEALQAVLLRAYRDGMAEVNHVHIEGREGNKPIDLTLMFQVYRPPMSAEEAVRLTDTLDEVDD
jgi:hypothetical protein